MLIFTLPYKSFNNYLFINFKIENLTKFQKDGFIIEYFTYVSNQPINIEYDDLVSQLNEAIERKSIKAKLLNFATIDALEKPLTKILNEIANLLITDGFVSYSVNYILTKPIQLFKIDKTDNIYITAKNVKLPESNYELMYDANTIAKYIQKQIKYLAKYDELFNPAILSVNQTTSTTFNSNNLFSSNTNANNNNALFKSTISNNTTTQMQIDINTLSDKLVEALVPKLVNELTPIINKLVNDLIKEVKANSNTISNTAINNKQIEEQNNEDDLILTDEEIEELKDF